MCVRGGDLCFGLGTCPPVLPHVLPPSQQGTWLYFFFPSSSLHFLPFSLSPPPFFPSLSLSFSVFFVFLPENQSEERGRVKRESARKAGTNHPACTFVSSACRLSSLPFPKPIRLLAAHSSLTLPSQSLVGCRSCRGSTGGGTALALRASQGRWLQLAWRSLIIMWRSLSQGTRARGGWASALHLFSTPPGCSSCRPLSPTRLVPSLLRRLATGRQAPAVHVCVCVRACAPACACLVESQAERRGGMVGSRRRGAGELGWGGGGALSISLPPLFLCWIWWLLSPCLSPPLSLSHSLCLSHGASQNSAL